MATWETTLNIALTSLLSGLIVAVVAVLLNVRFAGKSLYEVLMSRRKVYLFVVFILVLLVLLMPVLFSLSRGTWLSPTVLAVYVRELLVSVVVVVSFGVTWKALNYLATARWTILSRLLIADLSIIAGVLRVTRATEQRLYNMGILLIPILLKAWDKQRSIDIQPIARRFVDAVGLESFAGEIPRLYDSLGHRLFGALLEVCQDVGIIVSGEAEDGRWVVLVYDMWDPSRMPRFAYVRDIAPGFLEGNQERLRNVIGEERFAMEQIGQLAAIPQLTGTSAV